MNIYCNYHTHTSYSNINVYDSVAKVEEYCKRAKELGHKEVFTTEHGYQGFIFDWLECAEKYGLNVIEGAEVYYVKDRFEKKRESHHLIIIALNDDGAQELNEIISKAYLEGFYYKPRVDEELLFSLNPNDFVVTTACIGGMWNDKEFIVKCKDYFKDNFYLEIQDHNDDMQRKVNKHLLQLSKELNIKLIHGNDSHYIYQEDYKYRDLYVSTKRKGSKADKNEDDKDQQSRESDFILDYPDYDTILERYKIQGIVPYEIAKEALENTKIFHKATPITHINKDIKLTSVVDNPKKELRKILNNEWNKRKYEFPKEKWGEYKKAIKGELKTIEDCNMSAYFCDDYYISKLAQKKYGGVITKTGRGSAVSFILNNILCLTNIDRLSANITLYPSRFMSTTRILLSKSLPDIDINVADQEPFIKATYDLLGKDNCAWMASFKPLQAQSAFRLYCRSLGMDINEYDSIAKDLEKYNDNPKWNKLIKESEKFIGVIDSISPSPCSILIYDKPVSKELGLITINSKEEDEYGNKKNIEYRCCLLTGLMADHFKYLKNDYLKVLVIKIISETFKKVGVKVPSINELKELVAKDDKTWEIYEKGLTCTINQADSDFGTQCAMRYKPKSVEEMSAFVAILRPGCASLRDDFLDRKPYTTGVKELDNLLSDGSGRMIYQELIMKYLIWLGIEESETYGIIKKISKKKFSNEDLEELKSKLKKGWIKQVGKEDGFEKTWQIVEDASKYSFNASHSLSYAYDSVYQAYLKSHYPLEYYSTVLEMYNKDTDRTIKLTNELKYFGISLKPIKFGYSTSKYNYDKETMTIYKGVRSVKKMNAHVADELYELSQSKNYDNIVELLIDIKEKTNINKSQLENLIKLDYFSDYGNDKYILRVNDVIKTYMKVKQIKKNDLFDRGINEDIVRACSDKETEKMFKGINNLKLINMLILGFDKNEKCNIKEKCEAEVELLGECIYKNKAIDNYYYIVTNEIENARPKVNIHNLSNGENLNVYITHGFNKRPIKQFSIIIVNEINKEPKYKYIGKDDKGKAKYEKLDGQFKDVLSDYEVINY